MINAIILLAVFTMLEAIPCFVWYDIGLKKGKKAGFKNVQNDMLTRVELIVEKTKKEKDI
ncbi:hypothetical protein ACT5YR_07040 [Fructobacillus fructosus]|uniref:Uncharacterized protein n=1 Tax=Fructobacillus fructosus TaxID=1631 RepID=A0ABN9YIA9_9LACO|nr:unnamed protein product [Fructobacillus fructosus]